MQRPLEVIQQLKAGKMELGLANIQQLREAMNYPDRGLPIIHVGGTNGKGSVIALLASVLGQAGYKVGVFSSPHLVVPEECIRIGNKQIESKRLDALIQQYLPIIRELEERGCTPSLFEVLTLLSFVYFRQEKVDFVLLEVGLGGQLDATNIIEESIATVLTKISIDHQDFLGNTLREIATQKAGIIKPMGMLISPKQCAEVEEVLEEAVIRQGVSRHYMDPNAISRVEVSEQNTCFCYEDSVYELSLLGAHQAYNASLAITVLEALRGKELVTYTQTQLLDGLSSATHSGRLELISTSPTVFIDGAHNVDGIDALKMALTSFKPRYTVGIMGVLRDKDVDGMLNRIVSVFDTLIVVEPDNPRALPKEELAKKIICQSQRQKDLTIHLADTIDQALCFAKEIASAKQSSRIVGFGSLYMIGKIKEIILEKNT